MTTWKKYLQPPLGGFICLTLLTRPAETRATETHSTQERRNKRFSNTRNDHRPSRRTREAQVKITPRHGFPQRSDRGMACGQSTGTPRSARPAAWSGGQLCTTPRERRGQGSLPLALAKRRTGKVISSQPCFWSSKKGRMPLVSHHGGQPPREPRQPAPYLPGAGLSPGCCHELLEKDRRLLGTITTRFAPLES